MLLQILACEPLSSNVLFLLHLHCYHRPPPSDAVLLLLNLLNNHLPKLICVLLYSLGHWLCKRSFFFLFFFFSPPSLSPRPLAPISPLHLSSTSFLFLETAIYHNWTTPSGRFGVREWRDTHCKYLQPGTWSISAFLILPGLLIFFAFKRKNSPLFYGDFVIFVVLLFPVLCSWMFILFLR